VYSRGSSTIHNLYYLFISFVQTAVSFSSVSLSIVFLLSVNLLPASTLMFYLYYFLKLDVCSHLTWQTEIRPSRPSDTYWLTKYEFLTTALRKLLTSVPFQYISVRPGVHSKDLAKAHPPKHQRRTTCDHPLEIDD
jgi:hypothetical protein